MLFHSDRRLGLFCVGQKYWPNIVDSLRFFMEILAAMVWDGAIFLLKNKKFSGTSRLRPTTHIGKCIIVGKPILPWKRENVFRLLLGLMSYLSRGRLTADMEMVFNFCLGSLWKVVSLCQSQARMQGSCCSCFGHQFFSYAPFIS